MLTGMAHAMFAHPAAQVARMLQKREGELPEEYREELERLKDKEDRTKGLP